MNLYIIDSGGKFQMDKSDKSSVSNVNRIDLLFNKNPNQQNLLLDKINSKYIRNEIGSYLKGHQSLKIFDHNKKYLKEFSESDCFFQNKMYAEFLNDILMYSDVESIFYMCQLIFENDIKALEQDLTKLTDEEKRKFHFDTERNEIDWEFKQCLLVLDLPNILYDIFSITLGDFRKLMKKDLAKRPEKSNQPGVLINKVNRIKSSMICAYNALEKKSENQSNESKNCRNERLDYLKSIVLGPEKVKIKKFSADNLCMDDMEKKFRAINGQKLICETLRYFYFDSDFDRDGLLKLWDKFKCNNYIESPRASVEYCCWILYRHRDQYYTMLRENPEYFYSFNTLEEFDSEWNTVRYWYISTEEKLDTFKNKYYKYLFAFVDGDQDKFVKFLENEAKAEGDTNMLYRCSWSSAILRVMPFILYTILIIILIFLPFILFETILDIVLLFVIAVPAVIASFVLAKAYYTGYYRPFFANRTPFEYKYNRYLQNKYPILKPENRDEHFFDESKKFQEYKKQITNEKNRFDFIATKYQTHDKNIVEESKNPLLLDGIIQTKDEQK